MDASFTFKEPEKSPRSISHAEAIEPAASLAKMALPLQALYRGYVSRKWEASIEVVILKMTKTEGTLAKIIHFRGRLGHITKNAEDYDNYSGFHFATLSRTKANIEVLSFQSGLVDIKKDLDLFSAREGKVCIAINGAFFEVAHPLLKEGEGPYGGRVGHPIGPFKGVSIEDGTLRDSTLYIDRDAVETKVKNVYCDVEVYREVEGFDEELASKPLVVSSETHVPAEYKEFYGVLSFHAAAIKLDRYEELVEYRNKQTSLHIANSVISGAPILASQGKPTITDELQKAEKFQFPKIGECPPGYLLHGSSKNPRTVMGFNEREVQLLFVMGRERNKNGSPFVKGLSFSETSRLVCHLNMTEALNLDGGTSSFMSVKGVGEENPTLYAGREIRSLSTFIRVEI